MAYHQAKNDVSEFPIMKGYKMQCCDCGLVHTIDFTIIRKTYDSKGSSFCYEPVDDKTLGIEFKSRRNNRATGQIRRRYNKDGWRK